MKSAVLHFEESRSLLKYDLDVEELVNCRVHTYEAGECILQQGLAVDALFVILEGTARVCISAENGRSLILCSYVSSGILGDIELMLDEKIIDFPTYMMNCGKRFIVEKILPNKMRGCFFRMFART